MTINIALATNDAIVIGCDSVSSITRALVDPFQMQPAVDQDGNAILDAKGNAALSLSPQDIKSFVVNVVSGVEKMFLLYEKKDKFSVAATTAGMAVVGDQSVRAIGDEFRADNQKNFKRVEDVAKAFLEFVRVRYEQHFEGSAVPAEYWSELNFLVAGAGGAEPHPALFRVHVKDNKVTAAFEDGVRTGLAWDGQADGIERLISGYDSQFRLKMEKDLADYVQSLYETWSQRLAGIVEDLIERSELEAIPDDIDMTLPPEPEFKPPWRSSRVQVQYSSLPLQYAIDFVGFLVTAQSGLQRFTSSIATVGGRTHIGLLRKGYNFVMINEPTPIHRMTGFSDDA